jgi:hypothetical protein
MKKVLLSLGVVAAMAMTSCGIDVDAAAEEFCACKEAEDKGKCHDDWVAKYAGAAGSEEDGKKLGEKMAECDPMGLIEIAPKIQEATK